MGKLHNYKVNKTSNKYSKLGNTNNDVLNQSSNTIDNSQPQNQECVPDSKIVDDKHKHEHAREHEREHEHEHEHEHKHEHEHEHKHEHEHEHQRSVLKEHNLENEHSKPVPTMILDHINNINDFAQEPWPKDAKLFQPYEVEQILLPDNANCLAVQAFLKMCNLDFQIESRSNAEFMSPSGKVPFIKCGAFVVSELEGIVNFVSQKGISRTENLEKDQKSDLRAYMALINNVLGNAEIYICWCDQETYSQVTKPRYGSVYPWPLNIMQTWSKRSKEISRLKTLGWYEKTLEEVFEEVETCCQTLSDRLENNTYFFGNNCTEMDALIYGHMFSILTLAPNNSGKQFALRVKKFMKLINHCKNMHKFVMGRTIDGQIFEEFQASEPIHHIDTFGVKSAPDQKIKAPVEPNIVDLDLEREGEDVEICERPNKKPMTEV